ncbi:ABC transporter permease [Streptomyces sp. NPDC020707]|uniref:ABC transporter permease n=1 Tax=Streptomyces sp. NPDC020707 TaxID=3365084 RepID=UPI003788587B
MTTLLPSERPAPATAAGLGLARSLLRLHRSALWCWLLLVVALAATMLWAYGPGHETASADVLEQCRGDAEACHFPGGPWLSRYSTAVALTTLVVSFLPLLVAAWAGAALIGRELENGTAHLAWTQSVSPARWLAAKLAVPALFVTAGTALLVPLHRLMWDGGGELLWTDWFDAYGFRSNGTTALAYALCALSFGVLAGLVTGRTLPALGTAVAAVFALTHLGDQYRPSMWPTVTVTGAGALSLPDKALQLDRGVITDAGVRIGNNMACTDADRGVAELRSCLAHNDLADIWATYHPQSHFWPLQLVESGIVLAVAALAATAAFVLLRRRTAAPGAAT